MNHSICALCNWSLKCNRWKKIIRLPKLQKKIFFMYLLIIHIQEKIYSLTHLLLMLIHLLHVLFYGLQNNEVMERCLNLFKLDYNTVEISNRSGELSSHYPSLIVIPENEKQKLNGCFSNIFNNSTSTISGSTMQSSSTSTLTPSLSSATSSVSNSSSTQRTQQQTIYENSFDSVRLRELMNKARFARSRTRFPTPVILYKGKFVCRSSTLSGGPELYTRTSFNYLFNVSAPTEARSGDDIDSCREGKPKICAFDNYMQF